jgi:hypothetical protein
MNPARDAATVEELSKRGEVRVVQIVHAIRGGVAFCGLEGAPCDWPPGNTWVYAREVHAHKLVNCEGCRKKL